MDSPQHDTEIAMASQQEKEADPKMPFDYSQDSFWESTAFYQQSLATTPIDSGFFEQATLGLSINTSSPHYARGLTNEPSGISYSDWGGSISGDMLSGGEFSPGPRSTKANTFPEPNTRNTTGPRRPSAEAIARRRKQNRVSQAAWRARNKELVEELRQEIAEYSEYNKTMKETMRSLLKTTESLKGVIEHALALPEPKTSQDDGKQSTSEGQLLSPPESSAEGTTFDLDAPHDP
ncbi:uncharacterized protein LY89DRAFT_680975 [Mollisia scopiformis]|uniref:BZIP domain-containing protein n=1 Tax=Mollisia scopiformis TaxID=149040 RepID=A0A194XRH8_MOLSC|nr:uncharacterized protein LY89DRAFT_680975 [Mollisia scopiformis]KUJ22895.1 hypothetical protein LY89DRAFT_680975 [Mollisia scopiformis]